MSEREQGCLNASCHLRIGPPPRQHTNGPCNCLRDIPTPRRIEIKRKLAALRAKVERLEGDKLRLREVVQKSAAAAESFKPALERLLMQIELGFVERVGLRRKFRAAHTQLAAVLRETEANTETGRK